MAGRNVGIETGGARAPTAPVRNLVSYATPIVHNMDTQAYKVHKTYRASLKRATYVTVDHPFRLEPPPVQTDGLPTLECSPQLLSELLKASDAARQHSAPMQ